MFALNCFFFFFFKKNDLYFLRNPRKTFRESLLFLRGTEYQMTKMNEYNPSCMGYKILDIVLKLFSWENSIFRNKREKPVLGVYLSLNCGSQRKLFSENNKVHPWVNLHHPLTFGNNKIQNWDLSHAFLPIHWNVHSINS